MTTTKKIVNYLADRATGLVPFALIHWFATANDSRVTTEPLKLASKNGEPGVFESIREEGWKQNEAIDVQPFDTVTYAINGIRYTADMAIAERLTQMARWKADSEANGGELYALMLSIWFEDGDINKPIRPVYMGIDGNRRALAMPSILLGVKEPELFTVPVVCRYYADNLERLVAQLSANTQRTMSGVKNLTPADFLKAGVKILDGGGNENTLRRAFGKVGTAQKIYAVIKLSHETADYAKSKGYNTLLHRCTAIDAPAKSERQYVENGWVPVESLDKEQLRTVRKAQPVDGETVSEAIGKALETYIVKVFDGAGRKASVTDKTVWDNTTADSGSPFDLLRKLHLEGKPFLGLKESHPELFSAHYVGAIAEPAKSEPAKSEPAKSKSKSKR
jgi:hypothetical protein